MKQYEKKDWLYEFRPQIIIFFGLLGLFNFQPPLFFPLFSQLCGLILLYWGKQIMDWRREYRKFWGSR